MNGIQIEEMLAICLVSLGYSLQIWRIFKLKETKDLSLPYFLCLLSGFTILGHVAWVEQSGVFFTKQLVTFFLVGVIVLQIIYYRRKVKKEKP